MSDGGRQNKPHVGHAQDGADLRSGNEETRLPGATQRDSRWVLSDPMRLVRAERDAAASQIQRSLKAWRKQSGSVAGNVAVPQSGGSLLSAGVRRSMEGRLGADLSAVKVHTSGEAASAANGLGARAFTVGSDVHFGAGEYNPGTKEGDRLIAHELTHVVQGQRSGVQRKASADAGAHDGASGETGEQEHAVSEPHEPAELEADATADRVADDLHGGGGKPGAADSQHGSPSEASGKRDKGSAAGNPVQKAPAIGTKLGSRTVHLSPRSSAPAVDPRQGRKIFRSAQPGAPTAGAGNATAAGKAQPNESECIKDLNKNVFDRLDGLKPNDPAVPGVLAEIGQRIAKWKAVFSSPATGLKAFKVLEIAERERQKALSKLEKQPNKSGTAPADAHGVGGSASAGAHPTPATPHAAHSAPPQSQAPTSATSQPTGAHGLSAAGSGIANSVGASHGALQAGASHGAPTAPHPQPAASGHADAGTAGAGGPEQWCDQHLGELNGIDPNGPEAALTLSKLEQGFQAHGSLGSSAKIEAFKAALATKQRGVDTFAQSQLKAVDSLLVKVNPESPGDYQKIQIALKELQPWEALYANPAAKGLAAAYFRLAKGKATALGGTFVSKRDTACQEALAHLQKLHPEQPDFNEQLHKIFQAATSWLTSGIPDPAGVEAQLKAAHKDKLVAAQKPKADKTPDASSSGADAGTHGGAAAGAGTSAHAPAAPTAGKAEGHGHGAAASGGARSATPGGAHALKAGDEQQYMALHNDSAEVRPQLKPDQLLARIAQLRANPEWGPVLAHIPDPQLMAVIGYTTSDYRLLNTALLGQRDPAFVAKIRPYIALTQDALARLPDYVGPCWRGTELTPQQRAKYQAGKVVTEDHFFSTSYVQKSAFGGNTRYTIESKHGKIVDFVSTKPGEKECMFMAGSRFLVLEVEKRGETSHIRMRQI